MENSRRKVKLSDEILIEGIKPMNTEKKEFENDKFQL